ncbi:MAG: DNA primase [Ruminococcaceae bacterium]|nr:DNA primase [Oscillospiraceae bacterium]
MALPQGFIEELHEKNDIVEIVSSHVELKRFGRLYRALCPFHSEKTASFTVYPDTQSFYCFGCGVGGDVITFVMKQENFDYMAAVRFLSERVGLLIPDDDGEDESHRRRKIYDANKKAARFFYSSLNSDEGRGARGYLRKRGLADSTIKRFGIGYAPSGWRNLYEAMLSQGLNEEVLFYSGLCGKGKKGPYDIFRNRIIFPIIDLSGNVAGFGGRSMGEGAKYINTSETSVFRKRRNLYALNIARKSSERSMILVEGYMDVISLHQEGLDNAIATLGTAITPEQARIISKYSDEVVLAYDTDGAGKSATNKAIAVFRKIGMPTRIPDLSGSKDPDEFIKEYGAESFKIRISKSGSSIDYELSKARENNPVELDSGVAFLREATAIISSSDLKAEREIYAGKLSEEFNVDKNTIMTMIERAGRKRYKRNSEEVVFKASDIKKRFDFSSSMKMQLGSVASEQRLISLFFLNPDLVKEYGKELEENFFKSKYVSEIYEELKKSVESGSFFGIGSLSGKISEDAMNMLTKSISEPELINFSREDVEFYIERIRTLNNKLDFTDVIEMDSNELRDHLESKRNEVKEGNE